MHEGSQSWRQRGEPASASCLSAFICIVMSAARLSDRRANMESGSLHERRGLGMASVGLAPERGTTFAYLQGKSRLRHNQELSLLGCTGGSSDPSCVALTRASPKELIISLCVSSFPLS